MTPTLHPNAKRWLHPNWKKILKTDLASPLFGRLPYGLAIDMHSPREVREELVRIYWRMLSIPFASIGNNSPAGRGLSFIRQLQ